MKFDRVVTRYDDRYGEQTLDIVACPHDSNKLIDYFLTYYLALYPNKDVRIECYKQ